MDTTSTEENTKAPDPRRTELVRRAILECLDEADMYPRPEAAIRMALRSLLCPPPSPPELAAALAWLKGQGLIKSMPEPLDPETPLFFITLCGQTVLHK